LLSGGNMDGVSGPGVGSARSVVQAGGVGIIMFGVADKEVVGSATEGVQAVIYMERRKKKEMDFCIAVSIFSVMHTHLIAS
jgi:hypothetical protein